MNTRIIPQDCGAQYTIILSVHYTYYESNVSQQLTQTQTHDYLITQIMTRPRSAEDELYQVIYTRRQ